MDEEETGACAGRGIRELVTRIHVSVVDVGARGAERVDKEETGACAGRGLWQLVTRMHVSVEREGRSPWWGGHSPRSESPEGPSGSSRGQGRRLGASVPPLRAPRVASQGQPRVGAQEAAGPGTRCVANTGDTAPGSRCRRHKGVALDSGHSRLQTRKQMSNAQQDPDGASTRAGRGLRSSRTAGPAWGPRGAQGRAPPMKAEPLPPSPSRAPQSRSNEGHSRGSGYGRRPPQACRLCRGQEARGFAGPLSS